MAWDFSLGNVGATIADVLKSRDASKTQQAIAQTQVSADQARQTQVLSLASMDREAIKFLVIAAVIVVIGYQLAKRA